MPEEKYPIMNYMRELEDKNRKLQWQVRCHRMGSFTSGLVIGIVITLIAMIFVRR